MNFEDFCAYVENHILSYLPDEYRDYDVSIYNPELLSKKGKTAIVIRDPERRAAPAIYIDGIYKTYQEGLSLDKALTQIAAARINCESSVVAISNELRGIDASLVNWEYVRDRVTMTVVGYERNKEELKGRPYTKEGDIAVVYGIYLGSDDQRELRIPITNDIFAQYGVSRKKLHETAVNNTVKIFPPQISGLSDAIEELMDESGQDITGDMAEARRIEKEMGSPLVVMNTKGSHGAEAMFYPGILDKIYKRYPDGFYIIPSSVNEVLILPKQYGSIEEMEGMLRTVNQTCVSEEEFLSDTVHEYDPVRKKIYAVGQEIKERELNEKKSTYKR